MKNEMENNSETSNSGQFLGIIALILSVLAGFSAVLCCFTFIITLLLAIPFGLVAIFLGFLAIIFGKIGMSQAKKSNSPLLLPKTGLILGIVAVSIIFLGIFILLFLMGSVVMN